MGLGLGEAAVGVACGEDRFGWVRRFHSLLQSCEHELIGHVDCSALDRDFVGEITVEAGGLDVEAAGEFAHGEAVEAFFVEDGDSSGEDLVAGDFGGRRHSLQCTS